MNWKNKIYPIILIALLGACDSFQEDIAPMGERELDLKEGMTALPNTSLFIDLKKTIRSSNVVKFSLSTSPNKGTVTITDQAILEYKPHADFINGTDFFSLNMLTGNNEVVDTDTLFITMANSADSLPCFNGALSDYYSTYAGQDVAISPLINDGYCAEDITAVEVNILEEPANGELRQVVNQLQNVFSYVYTPATDFVGEDVFTYDLTITSVEGEEYYSMAKVYIEVIEADTFTCDSLIQPTTYFIYEDSTESHLIDLYYLDPLLCGGLVNEAELEISSVYSGSAEVYDSNSIIYYPGADTIDFVEYQVNFPNHSVTSNVTIIYDYQTIPVDTTDCLKALDDAYQLYVIPDSIGSQTDPYILNLAANDIICNLDDYQIRLLTDPDVGVATINENQNLEYYTYEEFTGVMEFSMLYELCDNSVCDSAFVNLSVEK